MESYFFAIAYIIISVNIAGFIVVGIDKYKAGRKLWRIPERVFFGLQLLEDAWEFMQACYCSGIKPGTGISCMEYQPYLLFSFFYYTLLPEFIKLCVKPFQIFIQGKAFNSYLAFRLFLYRKFANTLYKSVSL